MERFAIGVFLANRGFELLFSEWRHGRSIPERVSCADEAPNARQVVRIKRVPLHLILYVCFDPILSILTPWAGFPSGRWRNRSYNARVINTPSELILRYGLLSLGMNDRSRQNNDREKHDLFHQLPGSDAGLRPKCSHILSPFCLQ